jgi:hypothetical protein
VVGHTSPTQVRYDGSLESNLKSHAGPAFEYDRAGTVLALAIQYSRIHVRKELRGESFHVLESSQVLLPSACLKTTPFTFSEYHRLLFIR